MGVDVQGSRCKAYQVSQVGFKWIVLWLYAGYNVVICGLRTEKPELHEVPGHSCNSGAQNSPKTTPREPPGNSTPEAHEPAKLYYFFL